VHSLICSSNAKFCISAQSDFWDEEDKVSCYENELLEASFTEDEVKTAIF
jgi:hypothetical protein